ncbi:ROK family protein [Shewanella sp. SNU WT4]|nr:ROK family protein [Shewanella sp. SNU WT4]
MPKVNTYAALVSDLVAEFAGELGSKFVSGNDSNSDNGKNSDSGQGAIDLSHQPLTISADTGIGIGIPGTVSHLTGLIKNANSTWLNGQGLQQDLQALIKRPVRVANDANCFALSEAIDGAGQGEKVVFGVILGTGCGAGLVINGQVHLGNNGLGGEWGHNPLPWLTPAEFQQRACYCGRYDCIEHVARAISLVYGRV